MVCIQAVLQDKPNMAAHNLPKVGAIFLSVSYLASEDLLVGNRIDNKGVNNDFSFLLSI